MITTLIAALAFRSFSATPAQYGADITASLVCDEKGNWSVKLVGPANPADWAADPDNLQLSLLSVGDEPGGGKPTLDFQKPNEGVMGAFVKERADSEASIPVTLSAGSRGACFARVSASGFVLSTDPVTHKMISLPVHGSHDLVYIPSTMETPQLQPGLRFFYLPQSALDLKQEDGTVVPFAKGVLRELRLESIDQNTDGTFKAHFRLEGWPEPVSLTGNGDPLAIPGLPPILYDESVRKLRTKYLNKPVWVYGGSLMTTSEYPDEWASVRIGVTDPIVPHKILRLYTHHVMLNVGPQIAALGGQTNSSFYADCPIYIVADIGKRGEVTAAMGSSSDDMGKMMKREIALTGCQVVADEWQFERTFSLKSGQMQHPDWIAEPLLSQSVLDGKVQKGMTHAMVAWTLGWPGEPSSKKTLMSWPKWRYDIVAPYSFWVQFEGDRVVKFGEDGKPPKK